MNVVLDANVFISAIIRGGIPQDVIIRIADRSDRLFITDEIVAEIEKVLVRPMFGLSAEEVEEKITRIKKDGTMVAVSPLHRVKDACRDLKDNIYLECALAAGADYIITGDKDLLVLKEYGGVKIVNARSYLDIVGG